MSEEHGDDLNFNELVGNLLSSHNANESLNEGADNNNPEQDSNIVTDNNDNQGDVELPDFGAEEDLAAVVASAIQNMNEEPSQSDEISQDVQQQQQQRSHQQEDEREQQALEGPDGEADEIPIEMQEDDEDERDHEQNQEWANMLQQSLLQGDDPPQTQPEEQLDQDDETLRRAILESLQELNVRDKEDTTTEAPLPKEKDKKSKPKKPSKKSSSSSSSSKKKKDSKKKKPQKDDNDDLLNFEDVIRGFMHPETSNAQDEPSAVADVGDNETQALVEATLKAFERELLGPAANAPKTAKKKSTSSSSKKKSSSKKSDQRAKARTYTPLDLDKSHDGSKHNKKKQRDETSPEQEIGDDFSKQLAEMVNQVVNTTAPEEPTTAAQKPEEDFRPSTESVSRSVSADEEFSHDMQTTPAGLEEGTSETFDLNQIMQRAMNMAFQEQEQEHEPKQGKKERDKQNVEEQQDEDHFDHSIMEEFNRGLADLSVADLDTETTTDSKDQPSKEDDSETSKDRVKHKKSTELSEEINKKKYSQVALAAAHAAKKRLSEKNKINKLKEKEERQKVREDKKSKKKEEQEKLEEERKELEEIVAKGPPYPPDLRLTKSGKPKKPYRRWTPEEMAKRAAVLSAEANNPSKEQKVRKKKSKKLKRVPLYNLKNIPIFNFIKSNVSNGGRARQGLNGIEDTLNKIPLTSNNMNLNKLALPSGMNVDQSTRKSNNGDLEKNPMPFMLQRKTVVHREKIPFHPPWAIPAHPPLALPVARRRRKERINESTSHDDIKSSGKQRRSSGNLNVRSKIIPAVLLPIINTLKAAARAKAASGASSEESNEHLMNIIKHTKTTIAETLESTRRNSPRDVSVVKTQPNTEDERKKIRRMPIFSLANIKKIDTSNDEPRPKKLENHQDIHAKTPTLIKVEETEKSSLPDPQENINKESSQVTTENTPTNEKPDSNEEAPVDNGSVPADTSVTEPIEEQRSNHEIPHSESPKPEPEENTSVPGQLKVLNEEAQPVDKSDWQDQYRERSEKKAEEGLDKGSEEKSEERPKEKPEERPEGRPEEGLDRRPEEKLEVKSGDNFEERSEERLEVKSKEKSPPQVTETGSESVTKSQSNMSGEAFNLEKQNTPALIKSEESHGLGNAQTQIKKQYENSHNAFEDLVKQQLVQSCGSNVDLPSNLTDIISATLANVFPDLNDNKKNEIQEPPSRPERRRYKKGPPPMLNLDGLVPPSGIQVIPKAEPKPVSEDTMSPQPPRPKKPHKKSEQPVLLHTFNVPNFKDMQGRRTMLLKRAKEHLDDKEMGILKREINKERKRKWREVNVEKNWEHDLRSRLKKRANMKFGESNSVEKSQWFESEVSKNLSERGIKQEDSANHGNENGSGRKNTGSTNLSDNEVLNMIATALGKLDVARILERELNELGKPNGAKPSNVNKSKRLNTRSSTEGTPDVERNTILSRAADFGTVEEVRNEGETDEVDENGQIKRPYPDDIPLMVPILKRPKFLNAEGNS
ncbi:hypothetical protein ZYGR_0AK06010 [Zygosaccharomyces rouxii]|uniref:DUF3020 domain-containing protein n=1 Tax=Zygosaccharomyces rouxii TaxID=4956 RepID=A0A1Q3AEA7_ZYGRO|nr:hypothetical protein ZYGR_0AK06010 [Zygosaccharomyces rouxii]